MKQWEIEQLDSKVKSIEAFVGVEFRGSSVEDKLQFVEMHWEERIEITDQLLIDAYKEMSK